MAISIISKTCYKCKEIKLLTEFHRDKSTKDGIDCRCKQCKAIYDNMHLRTPAGRKVNKRSCAKYARTKKGKAAMKRADAKRAYSNKRKAKSAVSYAIRTGKLISPKKFICTCNNPAQEYHHHLGYEPEHWLDVVPLCIKCHKALHNNNSIR